MMRLPGKKHSDHSLSASAMLAITAVLVCGCRESGSATSTRDGRADGSTLAASVSDIKFPHDVAGLQFGIKREDAQKTCEDAGFKALLYERSFAGVGAVPAITCAGLPRSAPFGQFTQLEGMFCKDLLCVVKLVGYDGAKFEPLREAITKQYGPVRADHSSVPAHCTGAALAKCLQDGSARRLLVWSWSSGFPQKISSMIRLVHTASAQGEYVFLFFSDAAGSDLIATTAEQEAR